MRILKIVFDFYLNASIHVALAVFALTWLSLKSFGIPYDAPLLYFVFFATISGYNFVKYYGIAKWHHRRLANWLKVIQLFSLLCFFLLGYFAMQLRPKLLLYVVVLAGITFLYAVPFMPKRFYLDSEQNLRSISGLKVYVIALVWAGVTVFLPLLNNAYGLNADVVITGFQRFIFVIVLMLPFEIRDLTYDNIKLATIPQ